MMLFRPAFFPHNRVVPDAMKDRLVTVFEAINHTRKEIFVGVTTQRVPESIHARTKDASGQIAHWKGAETVECRSIADNVRVQDACRFAAHYAAAIAGTGWRIILQMLFDGD
jgi:hypothetical protein